MSQKSIDNFDRIPGTWLCPQCGFVLTKQNLYVKSGTVGPDESPFNEICPNDGQLMKPQTYKNAYKQVTEVCVQLLDEMNWLDKNCSFVANDNYNLGPFKVGELRKLARAGIEADKNGTVGIPTPEILFFGCIGKAGHYLRSKTFSIQYRETPWGNALDGGLLIGVRDSYYYPSENGKYVTSKKGGWTAIAFWDRSGGDTRPGCNSVFLAAADISDTQLIQFAKAQWPEIFSRPNFPNLYP